MFFKHIFYKSTQESQIWDLLDLSEQNTLSYTASIIVSKYGLEYHTSKYVKLISELGVFLKHPGGLNGDVVKQQKHF